MSRPLKPPSYLSHTGADGRKRARTVLRWPGGRVEHRSLGAYGSPRSHAEHARLVAEWRAAWEGHARGEPAGPVRTVGELALRYLECVRSGAAAAADLPNLQDALRPLQRLYGHTPLADFGPKSLKALRLSVAQGGWLTEAERARRVKHGRPLGMARKPLNRHLWRLKKMFAWAESEELVPRGTHHAMLTVGSLREGESGVRETDEVPPAPEADVAAVLPRLNRVVAALVRLQLLTGARPGELVKLRPCDLDRSGTVELRRGVPAAVAGCWAYAPKRHKTAHRNHRRVVLFGPQAQAVLAPFLEGREGAEYLFKPSEGAPSRNPGPRYLVRSYNQAVGRACKRAGVPKWHVHQLRHNAATRLVEQFGPEAGLEIARIVLGHRTVDMTLRYSLSDVAAAARAIGQVG